MLYKYGKYELGYKGGYATVNFTKWRSEKYDYIPNVYSEYYFSPKDNMFHAKAGTFRSPAHWHDSGEKGTFIQNDPSKKVINYIYYGRRSETKDGRLYEWYEASICEAEGEPLEKDYYKGDYIGEVIGEENQYPSDGKGGDGYWYVRLEPANRPPAISGNDLDLGSKTTNFNIEYIVTDPDGNACNMTIKIDNNTVRTHTVTALGINNIFTVNIKSLNLGPHTLTITADDQNGGTATRTYRFARTNTAPGISGADSDLGGKSLAFSVSYRVWDPDEDAVSVASYLDETPLQNLSNAQNQDLTLTITDELIKALAVGSKHTVTISANDSKGGVTYRRYYFTKVNTAPIISGIDKNLGKLADPPKITFSVTDIEKDTISASVDLRNDDTDEIITVLKNLENVTPDTNITVDMAEYKKAGTQLWSTLPYANYKVCITARDKYNINTPGVRNIYFSRISKGLEVIAKLKDTGTYQPKKIIAVPELYLADKAILKVEACNNYLDDKPVWEDITAESVKGRAHVFINASKTSQSWFLAVKVTVENGKAASSSILRGIKGGYE